MAGEVHLRRSERGPAKAQRLHTISIEVGGRVQIIRVYATSAREALKMAWVLVDTEYAPLTPAHLNVEI